MPLLLLLLFLIDLLSVAFIFIDGYLWREWYEYRHTAADDYANRCLAGALALLAFVLLGRFPVAMLLSKKRPGEEAPENFVSPKHEVLKRPDGSRIHLDYWGNESGQVIIFVHGWNADRTEWFYQRKYFEKDYRLILMDLPGLGRSTRPDNKDFSLAKMARDLSAVIEFTGARNPVLWGHSIGGMTILTLLARHAQSLSVPVKGIILEHTTYTNPVKTILFRKLMTALQKPVLTPLCYLLIYLSPVVWIMRWMSYLNGHSHLMTRLLTFAGTQTFRQLDYITYLSTLAPPAVTARGVLGMFRYDVTQQLSAISVPTLVIAANKDRLTMPDASDYMKTHIPNAQLVTVAPGNHQGLVERHAEVNAAAGRFLQSLS